MTTIDLDLGLDLARIPQHVACVMDGNGRWAAMRGLDRSAGHAAMEASILAVAGAAADLGVRWLTLYAFSTENWNRPGDEVAFLMALNEGILRRRTGELAERGIRVQVLGRPDVRLPETLVAAAEEARRATADNDGMTLTLALNYGGRAELVDAMRGMLADRVPSGDVDEDLVRRYLYDPGLPDPDLMVRTSGETRLSNFLLWELAYSELVFTDVLWPDFGRAELHDAIREYQARDRRFGAVRPAGGRR